MSRLKTRIDGDKELLESFGIFGNAVTKTADYTLTLEDNGGVVIMNKATGNALTVPRDSSVAWPVGSVVTVVQIGAGATTLTAGAGVTINKLAAKTLVMNGAGSVARLIKTAADTWNASGDLA